MARLIDTKNLSEDENFETKLRPLDFKNYIGQKNFDGCN